MECTHSFIDTTWSETIDGKAYAIAVNCARPGCNARLSLGPSNDADVPADEIIAAVCAHSDADHAAHESLDGWPWDVTKPLAEQWPWNGRKPSPDDMESLRTESHLELTGPTDQGQPLDGGMTGYIDQGQLDRLTAMCTPVKTLPLRVVLDGGEPFDVPRAETREEYNQRTGTTRHTVPGEPFAPEDSATKEPWADPGASTQMTDAELVETMAYSPPGSVRDDEMRCCPREAWGDGTHDLDCPQGGRP